MFELIIVGIMFAGIVGLGCFGMAYILSEAHKIYSEIMEAKYED